MKTLTMIVVLVLCIGVVVALPTQTEKVKKEQEALIEPHQRQIQSDEPRGDHQESALTSVDAHAGGDQSKRSKRFVWFGWGWPPVYPYAYVFG